MLNLFEEEKFSRLEAVLVRIAVALENLVPPIPEQYEENVEVDEYELPDDNKPIDEELERVRGELEQNRIHASKAGDDSPEHRGRPNFSY